MAQLLSIICNAFLSVQVVFGQQRRKVFLYDGPDSGGREVAALEGLAGRTLSVYTRREGERRPAACPQQAPPQAR